jgi:regulator of PEP synthase PpsR (kinase-PPPase family)
MPRPTHGESHPHVVLIVSDGTGITGERVVRAAVTQFDSRSVVTDRIAEVRDTARITAAIEEAARRGATVLYSLVSPEQRRVLLHTARLHHVETIDLLGPILRRLTEVLSVSPRAEPGIFHELDQEYFRRTDAVDFAVKHDDGRMSEDLDSADLVLVGVSRTSKTPLSIYLAYRGWRIANIPIILGMNPPPSLFALPPSKVVGLTARPGWLEGIRLERQRRMTRGVPITYSDAAYIREELGWFQRMVEDRGWTIVDVTHKAVEETAEEILTLLRG